jgi:hypothetical protein
MVALTASASAQQSLRKIDFKNFTYPLSGSTLGHDRLVWLDPASSGRHIRLVNGKDRPSRPGFTLDSVTFADLTGEGKEDGIVVLHFDTGGTQQTDYVYIYAPAAEKPVLLTYFSTGDRSASGLHKVYGENGKLVVELLDPAKSEGDCCSTGFVRTRYKWQNGRFEASGDQEFGAVPLQKEPNAH